MERKITNIVLYFVILLIYSTNSFGASLFESNWSTSVGTSSSAITDGGTWEWVRNDQGTIWYEVFADDGTVPGGRNYVRLTRGPLGNSNLLADSNKPLGNPNPLYFRMWFRLNPSWSGIEHLLRVRPIYDTLGTNQIYIFTIRNNFNGVMSVGFQAPSETAYMVVDKTITDNAWHMWEVKVEGAGSTLASFTCRLDGNDVTSNIRNKNTGTYLTSVNGSISCDGLNYQRWELYDAGAGAAMHFCDITGIKFTDGPNWIGDDNGDDNPPNVDITSPTSSSTYGTSESSIDIGGNASDDDSISSITWRNSRGGSGTADNDSGNWTSWSVANISLQEGENVITVTATDSASQTSTDTITVTYSTSMVRAWNANEQTGDDFWGNSVVTYCVRLLIEGDHVTKSGSTIVVGFQGRSSGNYTIRKVSIAERDADGSEGDVINSTWTRVTFDGHSDATWTSDVTTVPAGGEKLSNAIPFSLQAGHAYYVTFDIATPSVWLDPPSGFRELYFTNADHTEDIDWSATGYSTTQDFHSISSISTIEEPDPPNPPPNAPTGVGIVSN